MSRHVPTLVALFIVSAGLLVACEPDDDVQPLRVYAAASLADVLPDIASRFEATHDVDVEFSFAGSSRVARQIEAGAPADVFVSANREWVAYLAERGEITPKSRRVVAGNRLVWIEPQARESGVDSPDALASRSIEHLALAEAAVPAGAYAQQALRSLGAYDKMEPSLVRAPHVRAVVEWVTRGEVDAGIAYSSDTAGRDGVRLIFAFPSSAHDPIAYESAVTRRSEHSGAADFVQFLTSDAAREIFAEHGFAAPPEDAASTSDPTTTQFSVWEPIRLSLFVGLLAVLLGLVPAIALGWLLARRDFFGKSILSTVLLAPLAMPPVVTGFLLLELLGRRGFVGSWLHEMGLQVPFSRLGAILAAFTVGLPLFVLAARNAFEQVDTVLEDVAQSLGETRFGAFRRVTLPLAWPGLAAGATLMFARAVGEFGATAVLAGNVEGETRTLALAVYTLLETPGGRSELWWLVGGAIGLSFAAVLGYEWLTRWQRRRCGVRRG